MSQGLLAHGARSGGPLTVGIFVDASVEEMNRVAEAVGLDLIQLHVRSSRCHACACDACDAAAAAA